MQKHFADRLIEAIRLKGCPACVGLDPLLNRLPQSVLTRHGLQASLSNSDKGRLTISADRAARALDEFGRGVIEAVAPLVAAIKINIAFFEPCHAEGIRAYHELIEAAHQAGLLVIGDVKRADIGHTSGQYALAQLGWKGSELPRSAYPDAITVNAYFGLDGVQPFVDAARENGQGVFVLVQTSNASAAAVQGMALADGSTVCQQVARLVQQWADGDDLDGECGYSLVGAVVSPRDTESTRVIRELMPSCIFLVPGFGAQGLTAREVSHCFKPDGSGALVTASRSVIYPEASAREDESPSEWAQRIESACRAFVEELKALDSVRRVVDKPNSP